MDEKKDCNVNDIRSAMLTHEALVLARFRGDREFLREIYTVFLSEIPEKSEALSQAEATGDFGSIGEVAHALRSSGATIGVEHCSDLAARIEAAANHKNGALVAELNLELHQLFKAIAQVIEERLLVI
jgi:HPt (histidine-containing phosphotransfer) domain-containing protein